MDRLGQLVEMLVACRTGLVARNRMLALARSSPDPLARHRYTPGHFTASGFVFSPDRRSTLLVHHRRLDRWLQPGGHIDPTDVSVPAAARREVIEETGVDLSDGAPDLIDLDIHAIPPGKGEPAHEHFDVRFLFAASDTMLDIDRAEVTDARWFPLEELAGGDGDRSVRRVAQRLLE